MKRLISTLICVCLIFCLSITAAASPSHIIDEAMLLTDRETASLESKACNVSDQWGIDVVILTVDSTNGYDAQRYADDYYDYNGYGYSGILFLLVMDTREWVMSTSGECIDLLPSYECDDLFYQISDDLAEDDYYEAFDTYLANLPTYLEHNDWAEPGLNLGVRILISLLIGAAVGGITIWIMCAGMKTAKPQHSAGDYVKENSYHLRGCRDIYLYSHTSRVRKAENGGSSHRGSSGRSHGGSRGRF